MTDLQVERTVATLMSVIVTVQTILAFRHSTDTSAARFGGWFIMALCIAGPLIVAWAQNGQTDSRMLRRSLTWLSVLLYAGILTSLQLK